MTPSEWRTLIEAFLERRIGPDAFARRFIQAFHEDGVDQVSRFDLIGRIDFERFLQPAVAERDALH